MLHIEYGKYYHIYNRGINSTNIFFSNADYIHFLDLMSIYLKPVADIYAFALLKNHFHLAIRIKENSEIGFLDTKNAKSTNLDLKWKTAFPKNKEEKLKMVYSKKPVPEKMLQHLFSSYVKWINKKHQRTGALLEHPFDRILVNNNTYLRRLIIYIHNNPVKHGFCRNIVEYPWTSYLSMLSIKPTKLSRQKVVGWFDGEANFIKTHKKDTNFDDIEYLLLE
ncbi:MAG TPA: hypothetical protein EYG92_11315 [Lutibacter sp.]|nr:hypothetical protein [Lutibacter sp.]